MFRNRQDTALSALYKNIKQVFLAVFVKKRVFRVFAVNLGLRIDVFFIDLGLNFLDYLENISGLYCLEFQMYKILNSTFISYRLSLHDRHIKICYIFIYI